jgi:hypothetical protein
MSYLVIAHETTGGPSYREVDGLDEATRMVEQLRNEEGVEHARICRLEDVSFEFRPYFRVQVQTEVAAEEIDDVGHELEMHRRGLFGR